MKMGKWLILILLCVGTSACTLPGVTTTFNTPVPGPSQTWIDAPLPNSKLPLLPYKLVFHGASFVGVTEFELQINGVVIATVPPVSSSSGGSQKGTLFLGEYLWNPPAPGTYLISVRAQGNGQFSSPDQVQVTVSGDEIETQTSTPTATFEEAKECTFTALINLFCRLGPGMDYRDIDDFVPEQSAPIVGQSADSLFWYVIGPRSGVMCTVPTAPKFGTADGDCSELPIFTPVPLPTATPTEVPTGCTVLQESGAIECIVPCPVGAEPGEICTP